MIIDFEEKTHCYSVNGDIASISVTELLKKHQLSPNYGKVSEETLKESAERGKLVHKDLESILNEKNYTPTTKQGEEFKKWVDENLDCGVGEQVLAFNYKGIIIAGTADIMAIAKNKVFIVADHKNTSKFHREYVSWQVSLLDYFARKLGKEKVNGKLLNWPGATRFICFKYDPKTGEMTVYELDKIPDTEIERLLECEYKGEIYQRPLLVIEKDLANQMQEAEMVLMSIETQYEDAKKRATELREQLATLMGEQGIKSYTTPNNLIKVTYIAPSESFRVDSTKLRREYPLVYEKCVKPTKKKGYVTISKINSLDEIMEDF